MKFLCFFLHIVALSALTVSPTKASSDHKTFLDFQAVQQNIVQLAQQIAVDMGKPLSNQPSGQKPSEQRFPDKGKPLPAYPPQASKPSTSYHQRANSYATNPDSDPPRYVRQLSDIGVERFKDINWLDIGLEHRTRYEWRNNDIRRIEGGEDNPIFLRNRS